MKNALFLLCISFFFCLHSFSQGPGCPNVNAGPDQTLPCAVTCTNLTATFFETGATTSYNVTSIPYAPPTPSSAWVSSFVNIDDRWSGVINLPFTFCFYGNAYTQLVIGANGIISFNTGYANGFCPWSYTATVPSSNLPINSIFGAYHDIDPSVCGQIQYAISGSYPCRTFMFDFNAVCQFSCTSKKTSQRIVLYETSNAIEVYIGNKPSCPGWNSGNSVIGIQNAAGDQGVVPAGRQTGNWTTSNEGWRFTPSGAPNTRIEWYSSTSPTLLGTGTTINVCPTATYSTYSAILTYTNCDNSVVTVSDDVAITMSAPAQPAIFSNSPVCSGGTIGLNTNPLPGATYVWSGPNGFSSNLQNPSIPNATAANGGNYSLYVVVAGCTSSTNVQPVTVISAALAPPFTDNAPCANSVLLFDAPNYPGATYVWSGPGGWNPGNVEDPIRPSTTPAMSGTYSLYIVINGCTSGTSTRTVTIKPVPATPAFTVTSPVCTNENIVFTGPTVANATYVWSGPGGWTASTQNPTRNTATLGMAGTYSLSVVVNGCTSLVATQNVIVNGPDIPVFSVNSSVCEGEPILFDASTITGATYVWSGPNGFTSNLEDPTITSPTAAAAGTYSLYVVSNGCTSATATNNIVINSIPQPDFTFNSPLCEGATLSLDAPTITNANYYWTAPGWTSNAEDTAITNVTTSQSGNYSLYVIVNGCTSQTVSKPITVNAIPATPAITSNSPVCTGSSLNLNTATVAGATYAWSGPNSFTSSLEDPTLSPTTNAMAGNYNLYLVVNGCTSATATYPVVVNSAPVLSTTHTNVNCPGDINGTGSASVISGGIAPFSFAWNTVPPQLTANATNLSPGTYIIGVSDSIGCTDLDTVIVTTLSSQPNIQGLVTNESCLGLNNGSINLTITGGSPPFNYAWSNTQTTEDIASLSPNNYSVTVTDQYQCDYTSSFVVTAGGDVNATQIVSNIACYGDLAGSITISPSGGLPPYSILVNGNPNGTQINNLPAGNYVVTVTDANGCRETLTSTIIQPPPVFGDSIYYQIRLGDYLTLSPGYSGGTGNLSVNWSPAYNLSCTDCPDPLAWPIQNTTYRVNITDENGCEGIGIVIVEVFHDGPFIPNSFTPGKDDLNETFKVSDYGIKKFELHVFDRWGAKLFYSDNIYEGWDGKRPNGELYPLGVYVYKTDIDYIDGTQKTLLGRITLLR
jgi:gliding motility-associated-like protein